jgi:hypothetical protein
MGLMLHGARSANALSMWLRPDKRLESRQHVSKSDEAETYFSAVSDEMATLLSDLRMVSPVHLSFLQVQALPSISVEE